MIFQCRSTIQRAAQSRGPTNGIIIASATNQRQKLRPTGVTSARMARPSNQLPAQQRIARLISR